MTISQQTFLGASLRGFTASLGWEGNSSNVDINLVEDDLNIRPGFPRGDRFTPTDVGLPATFVVSGDQGEYWDYTGLIKNYKQDNSPNGNPLYSVSLTDPRELLEGTKLILNNYYGSVSGINNILNVYGYMEDLLGLNSTDPTYENNFRGSEQTDAGIPYKNILTSLSIIASGLSSPHYGSMLKLKDRSYTLNLKNLPNLPEDYRIPNTDSMSCIDLISDICGVANYDYFVEMSTISGLNSSNQWIPTVDNRGNLIYQIDIQTVDRSSQPVSGVISRFIESVSGASVKNIGFEFRNQTVGKFLTGGPLSLVYYKLDNLINGDGDDLSINNNDYIEDEIHQYWGNDLFENLLQESRILNNTKTQDVVDPVIGRQRDSYGNFLLKVVNTTDKTITYSYEPEMEDRTYNKDVDGRIKYTDTTYFASDISEYVPKYSEHVIIDTKSLDKEIYFGDIYIASLDEMRAIATSQEAWNMYLSSAAPYEYIPIKLADFSYFDKIGITVQKARYKIWSKKLNQMVDAFKLEPSPTGLIRLGDKTYDKVFIEYYHTNQINIAFGKYYTLQLNNGFATGDHASTALYNLFTASAKQNMSKKDIQAYINQLATGLDKTNIDTSSYRAALIKKLYDHLYQYAKNYGKKYMVKMKNDELITKTELMPGGKYRVYSNLKPAQYGYLSSGQIASGISLGLIPEDYINLCDEQGKISAYMKVEDAYQYNLNEFNEKDIVYEYFLQNNLQVPKTAFIKINVEEEFAFVNKSGNYEPRVVFELPQILSHKEELKLNHFNGAQTAIEQLTFFNNNSDINFTVNDVTVGGDTLHETLAPMAITPSFVMIPFVSNTDSYGPWWKIGANGAMEYEKDESLVPWNYNGYEGMNYAALAKVSEVAGVQFDEYGSVEIPNVPSIPLGRQLQYVNSRNNQTIRGPYITDISVDFSEAGFKTTYKMQTWTPSFGKLSKYYSDKISKLTGDTFKNQKLELERKTGGFYKNTPVNFPKKLKSYEKHSSANIIAAQVLGQISSGQNILDTRVVFQPDYNTITQIDKDEFQNQAVMSIDGLLRPYTTNFDASGNLPHFEILDSGFYKFVSGRHPSLYECHPFQEGHDVFSVATDYTNLDGEQESTYLNDREYYHSGVSHRGLALRNPGIVIAGYGRALEDGKPVPNANKYYYDDTGAYSYLASGNENSDLYASGYMSRQDMWKVGPLGGLNWSKREKCWFAGTRLYEGYLVEELYHTSGRLSNLPYTQARMVLLDGSYAGFNSGLYPDLYQLWNRADASGTTIAEQKKGKVWDTYASVKESGGYPDLYVTITNRSTRVHAPSGAYVIAANMPNGEYRAIWIDCESEERDGIL